MNINWTHGKRHRPRTQKWTGTTDMDISCTWAWTWTWSIAWPGRCHCLPVWMNLSMFIYCCFACLSGCSMSCLLWPCMTTLSAPSFTVQQICTTMHSTSQNPLVLSSSMNSVCASLLFCLPFICLYCRQPALTYLNKPFCVSTLLLSFPRLPFNLSARLDSPPSREWRPAAGSAYISSWSVISLAAKFSRTSS